MLIAGLESCSMRLKPGQTPTMGHRREDVTHYPVLFWPVGAYLIIYRWSAGDHPSGKPSSAEN
jgi:hypothetical protein